MKQQNTLLFSQIFSTNRPFYIIIIYFIKNILQKVKICRLYGNLEVTVLLYLLLTVSLKETDNIGYITMALKRICY
jgi:hypothetical protein